MDAAAQTIVSAGQQLGQLFPCRGAERPFATECRNEIWALDELAEQLAEVRDAFAAYLHTILEQAEQGH